ncbi:MAG: hypothetical protein WKF83_14120, partial [Nocardioidaceae bacterium]
ASGPQRPRSAPRGQPDGPNGMLAILTATMSDEAFLSWGWRVAFLVSAVLVAFGLWIRLRLEDTPVFRSIQEDGDRPEAPVTEVFKNEWRGLLAAILSRLAPDILYALFTVFILLYGTSRARPEPRTGARRDAHRFGLPARAHSACGRDH